MSTAGARRVFYTIEVSDAAHKGAQAAADNYYILKSQVRAEQEALETIVWVFFSLPWFTP